jgi:murein DD-endopeptidase MepM/ murein hydrolase activator NlpD
MMGMGQNKSNGNIIIIIVIGAVILIGVMFIGLLMLLMSMLGSSKGGEDDEVANNDNGLIPAQQMFRSYYEEAEKKYKIPWNVLAAVHLMDPVFEAHSKLAGNAACPAVTLTADNEKKYESMINAAAAKYGIDACFFAAMIKQESGFDWKAESHVGAIGLTQIMPDKCPKTDQNGKKLSASERRTECFNPKYNLDKGAEYAKYVQELSWIHGDFDLMAAAYNAGPYAVQKYRGIPPYKETQNHVKVVRANHQQYIAQSKVTKVEDEDDDKPKVKMEDVKKWIMDKAKQLADSKASHRADDACGKKLRAKQQDYPAIGSYGFELSCAIYEQAPKSYSTDAAKIRYLNEIETYANQYTGNNPIFGPGIPYVRGAKFQYPLKVKDLVSTISSPFSGARLDPVKKKEIRPHTGVDFAVPQGTKVYAVADGQVTYTGWGGGYGNMVQIQHAGNIVTTYNHLSKITIKKGPVKKGKEIGLVGSTGNSTGPHLHFEVRLNATPLSPKVPAGNPVDPMPYLGKKSK